MIREPIQKAKNGVKNGVNKLVYNLVKKYMKKQAFFSIEEMVEYTNQRLKSNSNINRVKIEQVLKSLIKRKIIIPGTKLVKENILDNQLREEIYNYIKSNAGTNINEIMKVHSIGSNHALWHLDFLEKFQFIRDERISNQKVYFKFDLDSQYDNIQFYLRNDRVQRMIELMGKSESSLSPTKISKILKMNYNTAKKYLEVLRDLNIVKIFGDNKSKSYSLNHENYTEVLEVLKRQI